MIVNGIMINASCEDILYELQRQLQINNIPLLHKIQDSSRNLMVTCPYHGNGQERRPSAGILKEDGTFHCFACGEVHTLPEVVSYCFGKDDMFGKWGMKWIVKNFATVSIEERKDVEIDMERNHTTNKNSILASSDNNKSNYVSEEELDSYRYYHKYWTKRGITDDNIIELFDLGYDKKTNCITFPVRDINGNCLFVARRSVKTKWFNYPKDVDKPLYGVYELNKLCTTQHTTEFVFDDNTITFPKGVLYQYSEQIYVTESMIDCLRLWQNSKIAVALNGTGSSLQFKQLRKLPCRHLILATDSDKAGMSAREKIRKNVRNKLITEVILPDGRKDIGECTDEEIQNLKEVF